MRRKNHLWPQDLNFKFCLVNRISLLFFSVITLGLAGCSSQEAITITLSPEEKFSRISASDINGQGRIKEDDTTASTEDYALLTVSTYFSICQIQDSDGVVLFRQLSLPESMLLSIFGERHLGIHGTTKCLLPEGNYNIWIRFNRSTLLYRSRSMQPGLIKAHLTAGQAYDIGGTEHEYFMGTGTLDFTIEPIGASKHYID